MLSNLDHVRAEEKLPGAVPAGLAALVVSRYFDRNGLQALCAGPAIKDYLGGQSEEQDGGGENSHTNKQVDEFQTDCTMLSFSTDASSSNNVCVRGPVPKSGAGESLVKVHSRDARGVSAKIRGC